MHLSAGLNCRGFSPLLLHRLRQLLLLVGRFSYGGLTLPLQWAVLLLLQMVR